MDFTGVAIMTGFFFTTVAVWGSYIFTRHRERVMILEKGLSPAEMKALYERSSQRIKPLSSLKWGILLVAVGVAVLLGMWADATYELEEHIYPALISLCGGIGLLVFYLIARKKVPV